MAAHTLLNTQPDQINSTHHYRRGGYCRVCNPLILTAGHDAATSVPKRVLACCASLSQLVTTILKYRISSHNCVCTPHPPCFIGVSCQTACAYIHPNPLAALGRSFMLQAPWHERATAMAHRHHTNLIHNGRKMIQITTSPLQQPPRCSQSNGRRGRGRVNTWPWTLGTRNCHRHRRRLTKEC